MCKKHASIQLIYGANGSGKSKMVRNLMRKKGSYLFKFNDYFSQDYVNKECAESMFTMLTGKNVSEIAFPSYSERIVLMFCYELEAILEMEEPYTRLFIDGFPCTLDKSLVDGFLNLFLFLNVLEFKVTVTTCDKSIRDRCVEYFENEPDFKLIEI